MHHKLAIAVVIASTACITSIAYPADETQVLTVTLSHATSREAATVLRTIVGVKKFEATDDHTIMVRDTQENLELAAAIVKMLDTTDDTADTTPLPAGDGSVIAAVVLDRASSVEVMDALRLELRIARIATAGEKRVFLRDTDSQIQAALKVIGRIEGNHEDSQRDRTGRLLHCGPTVGDNAWRHAVCVHDPPLRDGRRCSHDSRPA